MSRISGALDGAAQNQDADAMRRYRWAVIELLDQMVREESGGALETAQQR